MKYLVHRQYHFASAFPPLIPETTTFAVAESETRRGSETRGLGNSRLQRKLTLQLALGLLQIPEQRTCIHLPW